MSYDLPVSKLLTIGEVSYFGSPDTWLNYLTSYELSEQHISELIRMAGDEDLWNADVESPQMWGPVHAWRALGQLHTEEAIEPLLALFEPYDDSDVFSEDMFNVFSMIGPAALPPLAEVLARHAHTYQVSFTAQGCIEHIGKAHPDSLPQCIDIISRQLEEFESNDEGLNGFLVAVLVDFKAVEQAPLIERAFKADRVDEMFTGDWNEVQIEMGLKPPDEEYRIKKAHIAHMTRLFEHGRSAELGRNDPCWCGSGKKYKKCHLAEDRAQGW